MRNNKKTDAAGKPDACSGPLPRIIAVVAVGLALWSVPASAEASEPPQTAPADAVEQKPDMRLGLRAGVAAFLNSQSYRPAHFIKPTSRVEFGLSLDKKREVGVELVGTPSENKNYNLLGGLIFARAEVRRRAGHEMHLRAAFGAGSGPRILFKDLSYSRELIPWGQFGLDARWKIMPGMHIGTALAYENMSVLNLLMSLDFKV